MYPEDLSMSTASPVPYGHKDSYKSEEEPCLSKNDWLLIFGMGALMIFGILGITVGVIA